MKRWKKYNAYLSILLLIIVATTTLYFLKDKWGNVLGADADETITVEVDVEKDVETPDKKANFSNFSTALKYSQKYLKTVKGYKSKTSGVLAQDIKGLGTISQQLIMDTEIDNQNNAAHTLLGTWGKQDALVKTNNGYEFSRFGNEIQYRKTKQRTQDYSQFDFTERYAERIEISDFLKDWATLAEKVFVSLTSSVIKGGVITKPCKNGVAFRLAFTVEHENIIGPAEIFVKKLCGDDELCNKINPEFEDGSVVLELDAYGRPLTCQFSFNYELDLRDIGIPLSGFKGTLSYIQQFYDYGKLPTIPILPEKVEE